MQEMTLREICNIVGVSRRAVQGYEENGLVISSGKNKYGCCMMRLQLRRFGVSNSIRILDLR